MDRALMLAIMRQESAFQPAVGSRVGAQGLMQLMPATARYIARLSGRNAPSHKDLHSPATNMLLAQDYVGYLGEKLGGNMIHLLAAYNAGPGNVNRWRTRGLTPDDDPLMYIESIPLAETRDYVQKVLANWWIYQDAMDARPWGLQALADNYWPVVDAATGQGTRRKLAMLP
jgi:soluble lytic murein transglycosylase-like protein